LFSGLSFLSQEVQHELDFGSIQTTFFIEGEIVIYFICLQSQMIFGTFPLVEYLSQILVEISSEITTSKITASLIQLEYFIVSIFSIKNDF
jgi:hypothetical protein